MKKVSKQQKILVLRNGLQIWIDKDKAEILLQKLTQPAMPKMVVYEEELINTADVSGLFKPSTIECWQKRNNGHWKCNHGYWHSRGERCSDQCIIKYITDKHQKSTNYQETIAKQKEILSNKIRQQVLLTNDDKGLNPNGDIKLDYVVLRKILPSGNSDPNSTIDIGGDLQTTLQLQRELESKGAKTKISWLAMQREAFIQTCKEFNISTFC